MKRELIAANQDRTLAYAHLQSELQSLPQVAQTELGMLHEDIAQQTERQIHQVKKETNGNSLEILLAAVTLAQDAFAQIKGKNKIACEPGCHLCCHLKVELFDFEAYGIASYVMRWSKTDVIGLYRKMEMMASVLKGLDANEYATQHLPCVFLSGEGRCRIYEARPLVCVSYHSLSLAECQYGYDHPQKESPITQVAEILLGVPGVTVGTLRVVQPSMLNGDPIHERDDLHNTLLPILRGKILKRYGKEAL